MIFHHSIQCNLDEKVSDLIKKYRLKSGDNNKNEKFIYNFKQLGPKFTVLEPNLTNSCVIQIVKYGVMCVGARGIAINFTDVSKNITKEIGFSKRAPSYRSACKGINIFGNCHYKKCSAYKKEVVLGKKFHLIKGKNFILSLMCIKFRYYSYFSSIYYFNQI